MCVAGGTIAKVWQSQDLDLQEMVLLQSRALSCIWLPDVRDSRHIPPLPAASLRKASLTNSLDRKRVEMTPKRTWALLQIYL